MCDYYIRMIIMTKLDKVNNIYVWTIGHAFDLDKPLNVATFDIVMFCCPCPLNSS